ncbi:MAG TPA: amino acid permease [Longimicrobiales bacterium]|nr:amino acid permease [Longimicrobiales bacterium]
MKSHRQPSERTLGLLPATGVGVGAIVGGGVLALAGVAFATAGPGAIVAFALNGVIALLTAMSFAELASRFPESGGTYTYARKVLTVEAAFAVGWVVWFASVVAAVLYALGFAVFLVPFLEQLVRVAGGTPPAWIGGRFALLAYALGAVAFYIWSLMRSAAGGSQWATAGKVVVFSFLIVAGFWVLFTDLPTLSELTGSFTPFLERGGSGVAQAMGYTFIALQGFDLIAAVGGDVKNPERNIPRAMFFSLAVAGAIYLPLLFLIVAVGTDGQPVAALAAGDPEILVATAARNFLGPAGYWLVVVAGVLSMLSALQANLIAASSFARTMASDRTLPRQFDGISARFGTPVPAVKLTGVTVAFVLVAVPDVAAAGAVSSLIFLTSFALAHGVAYLVRRRASTGSPFQSPAFPAVPLAGGSACLALGLYQALAVPSAGVLAALWLSLGAVLYVTHLAPRARVVDASSEGLDPQIIRLRGRSPLVLVPIANPASARMLVKMAKALAPQAISRIQLLSVVRTPRALGERGLTEELADTQRVLGDALASAIEADLRPEALITVDDDPWTEIARIAGRSGCEKILFGVGELGMSMMAGPLERLIGKVDAHVVILRAPSDWNPDQAVRIVVPSRGGREQSSVRARLLGNLGRSARREVTFLSVLPSGVGAETARRAEVEIRRLANDEAPGSGAVVVARNDDVVEEVVARAAECDLLILGLQRVGRQQRVFGKVMLEIARRTDCPLLMISHGS